MKGRKHSDETRAAIAAALMAGQGVNEVARRYKIDKSVVSRIKGELSEGELQQAATQKKESIAALIEGHLTSSLRAAQGLADKVHTDEEWFAQQNAADIAVLYGVLTDKSIRILEAAQAGAEESAEGS